MSGQTVANFACASPSSILIAPLDPGQRMRSRRGLICIVSDAETADTPDSRQALLKSDEATIHGTIRSASIFRAPRIVLRFGRVFSAEDTKANS